jgi:hypothetical protein
LCQTDLTDQPISNPDVEYFTDGSSFVWGGTCFVTTRYVVVTLDSVIEAHLLPVGTSAQKAELVTLMWVLQLPVVNIYTDSKYSFTTIHVHRALYKEKGLINSGGESIKYGQEILELLDAVWAPNRWELYIDEGTKRNNSCLGKLES